MKFIEILTKIGLSKSLCYESNLTVYEFVEKLELRVDQGDVDGLIAKPYKRFSENDLIGDINFEDFKIKISSKSQKLTVAPTAYGLFTNKEKLIIDVYITGWTIGLKVILALTIFFIFIVSLAMVNTHLIIKLGASIGIFLIIYSSVYSLINDFKDNLENIFKKIDPTIQNITQIE